MNQKRVLIIDDEPDIRELLAITLSRMNIDAELAENVTQAKSKLSKQTFNLCLTDLRLPDGSGLEVVEYIQKQQPDLPVAVITAHGSMDIAIESMKAGAFDFLNKPIDLRVLRKLIESALASNLLATKPTPSTEAITDNIIGESEQIILLKNAIRKLSRSQAPVYICGESGTGKELVARSIHDLGPRAACSFIAVNCGAIPSELMESEFFGHKKGAFTGANSDKQGLFQAADGGTLFLDEVADLPLDMQVKLLRAIQEKAIRPVGAQSEVKTDVRILSATHKDLTQLVEIGEFRQDLFYRLNVIQLSVPPLRERQSDIPSLIRYFIEKLSGGTNETIYISKTAETELLSYSFPGNIRELENILERAYTLCEANMIEIDDLQLANYSMPNSKASINNTQNHYQKSLNYTNIDEYLAEIEKDILSDALEHVRWNKTLAAKKLGISFRSFRYRLQKLNMDDDT